VTYGNNALLWETVCMGGFLELSVGYKIHAIGS